MEKLSIAKEVVYALHQRIKDLSQDATPDKEAYLAKALESIAGQSTVFDIVQMTDVKLKELLDSTTIHLSKLDANKTNALAAISELEGKSLKKIDEKGTANLSLLDTRKDVNIAAINSNGKEQLSALTGLVSNFKTVNDVPSGSSIMKEVKSRNMIELGALPFLFGILSRENDYTWGYGHFNTALGKWYIDTSYTNNMFCLLSGAHAYDTSYVSFYKPPQLSFLQGKNGTFIYRELYSRYQCSSYEYSYPYALLGAIFVKNTTNSEITRTINFVGSSYWNSQYEGMGAFVGTPDNTNTNKTQISSISWKNIYNLGSANSGFSASGSVIIPANKTVVILLYTSPYYYTSSGNYYAQFMQWGIYNFRNNFLTTGLEVDVKRTLKAWQCSGLSNTYELWR